MSNAMSDDFQECRTCGAPEAPASMVSGFCRKCRYEHTKRRLQAEGKWIDWDNDTGECLPEQQGIEIKCKACNEEMKAARMKWGRCGPCRWNHYQNKAEAVK